MIKANEVSAGMMGSGLVSITVQTDDFDVGLLTRSLYAKNELNQSTAADKADTNHIGAVATFVGLVRTDDDVLALSLQHYPGMTEHSLCALADEALARWALLGIVIVHRVGRLSPGEQIVYVGVASSHRRDALTACSYLADQLKTRAVLWKQEHRKQGSRWLEPSEADNASVSAWHEPT